MLAEENIEMIRRAFIAWNTRDLDALIADSASDVEWDFSHVADWTEKTTYRGLPELRSFWDLWLEYLGAPSPRATAARCHREQQGVLPLPPDRYRQGERRVG